MSRLIVLVLPAPAYGQGHNMTRQRHIAIGGNHEYDYRISFTPPIVTLSKPVEDGCVEIFAGQIFDLDFAKTAKPKDFAGYSRP